MCCFLFRNPLIFLCLCMKNYRKNYRKHRDPNIKPTASDAYQHKFHEISIDPMDLDDFDVTRGLGQHFLNIALTEKFYELQAKLVAAVKRIINKQLTKHQAEILYRTMDGYTQLEIADKLGICQTSVFKSLHGNMVYEDGVQTKTHGGSLVKLKRLCDEDAEILEILAEMAEVRGTSVTDFY